MTTQDDGTTTYILWVCGQIDPRYDQALYGVYHLAREGEGRTLCGQRAAARETKSTLWWAGDYGRPHWDAQAAEQIIVEECQPAA